uniref:Ig-like domain-containing protein n=1 Tax=Stegastes partitus TaxID=144197 RepID=A0A3B5B2W4_9TELE
AVSKLTYQFLSLCVQVIVPQQVRSAAQFVPVVLQCDYFTSANVHDVIVTWRYKPFCKEPENSSTSNQPAPYLTQDILKNCDDEQQSSHIVIQRIGTSEPQLGVQYYGRNIIIQNRADLVIADVMSTDSGMYFCAVDAAGDTTGDSDKEVRLIVNQKKFNQDRPSQQETAAAEL